MQGRTTRAGEEKLQAPRPRSRKNLSRHRPSVTQIDLHWSTFASLRGKKRVCVQLKCKCKLGAPWSADNREVQSDRSLAVTTRHLSCLPALQPHISMAKSPMWCGRFSTMALWLQLAWVATTNSFYLFCPPCEQMQSDCPRLPARCAQDESLIYYDECGCCPLCAKTLWQRCGGWLNVGGECGPELRCSYRLGSIYGENRLGKCEPGKLNMLLRTDGLTVCMHFKRSFYCSVV